MGDETVPSEIETAVAAIWVETLGVEALTAADDFFELGGDSVMVMSVLLRVEEKFGVYLDPADLFDAPCLSDFSKRVGGAVGAADVEDLVS